MSSNGQFETYGASSQVVYSHQIQNSRKVLNQYYNNIFDKICKNQDLIVQKQVDYNVELPVILYNERRDSSAPIIGK